VKELSVTSDPVIVLSGVVDVEIPEDSDAEWLEEEKGGKAGHGSAGFYCGESKPGSLD
jgi:hypothetical protein